MHVLTKIFIVLVALLTVLLVPLVVVYAHNEDNYKARYQSLQSQLSTAQNRLESVESQFSAERTRLEAARQEVERENRDLRAARDRMEAEVRQLEARLAAAEQLDAEINSKLAQLASTLEAGHDLTTSLVSEVRELRSDAMRTAQQNVELDEALREKISQLEVAVAARRALEEELARLRDNHAQAMDQLSMYVATFGALQDGEAEISSVPAPKDIPATVLRVRRNADRTLVEIDAGSRDGVKEGVNFVISDGGQFVGNLRIIEVDINRSTGVLSLEDPQRTPVREGQIATARKGR